MITPQYKSFISIHLENTFANDNFVNDFFLYYDCSQINVLSLIDFCEMNKKRIANYIDKKYTLYDSQVIIIILYFLTFKRNYLINAWFLNDNYLQNIIDKW